MKQNFRTLMFGIDNKEKKEEEVKKRYLFTFKQNLLPSNLI